MYGLVAGIVKLDDAGLHLIKDTAATTWASSKRMFGRGLLIFAPYLMKSLSVIGTAAMFMVGGGILLHGIPASHDVLHTIENAVWLLRIALATSIATLSALSVLALFLILLSTPDFYRDRYQQPHYPVRGQTPL